MKASAPLIKGYLPVRLILPSTTDNGDDEYDNEDETFFYVKEHREGNSVEKKKKKGDNNTTLFIANAPVIRGVETKALLQSLLGRYGEIRRVTLVANVRKKQSLDEATNKAEEPTFLENTQIMEKFAHVVFSSNKDMRRALRSLTELMAKINGKDEYPCLKLDKIEVQMLSEEGKDRGETQDGEETDSEEKIGILNVAQRYRKNCSRISRADLLEECNTIMQSYEDAEEELRRAKEAAAAGVTDDDGFITVTPSTLGSKRELEQQEGSGRRKKGQKRVRKKKEITGASELSDFYRFQKKETHKRTLQDLRRQFEEDLAKVKKMKEERRYRPF